MSKNSVVLVIVFLLGGCVAPTYNSAIKAVASDDLEKFWTYDESEQNRVYLIGTVEGCYRVLPGRIMNKKGIKPKLSNEISFVIDSNGNAFEYQTLKGTSNETVNLFLESFVKGVDFNASAENSAAIPVRVTEEISLFEDTNYCRPFSSVELFLASNRTDIWSEERL